MVKWLAIPWVALRLAGPYVLTPWRSPLLRWRMETYGLCDTTGRPLYADAISPAQFFRFVLTHRWELLRFLRWAASL